MSTVIRYAIDLIPSVIWFFIMYLAFYRLHRPAALWRRCVLLPLIGLWAILLNYVFNPLQIGIGIFYLLAVVVWFVAFALVCGNLRRSLVTVVYCITSALFLDIIFGFSETLLRRISGLDDYFALTIGTLAHLANELHFLNFLPNYVKILLWILWTVFYCRIARKYPVNLPLRSWLLTVLPPTVTVCALIFFWSAAENLLETGTNVFSLGLVMGIFLFLLNSFLFYWHITLLANSTEKTEWQRLMTEAQNAAAVSQSRTDSNWSREAGLSEAFVAKYQFSDQERRALELAVLGKADKEIAKEMGVTLSTVKTYLSWVYAKTDTYGRGGIFSLIHGGGVINEAK